MSKTKHPFLAFAALAAMEANYMKESYDPPRPETDKEKELREGKEKLRKLEKSLSKGLKQFHYRENSLFALNQKNADRKAKKKGWI